MASMLMPASLGVQGPGETTRCVGAAASISARFTLSLRFTVIVAPSSPRYWTRLKVNES